MSRSTTQSGLLALSLGLLGSCGQSISPATTSPTPAPPPLLPTVFETMTQTFMPQANKVWELAGALYADNGELDPRQLSDSQWQEVGAAAASVRELASALAQATALHVAPAGAKLMNEGTPGARSAAEVQAAIDANPQGFKDEAANLATVAGDLVSAAAARDAVKTDDASNRLTEVCTACHNTYWYPEEAAPQ